MTLDKNKPMRCVRCHGEILPGEPWQGKPRRPHHSAGCSPAPPPLDRQQSTTFVNELLDEARNLGEGSGRAYRLTTLCKMAEEWADKRAEERVRELTQQVAEAASERDALLVKVLELSTDKANADKLILGLDCQRAKLREHLSVMETALRSEWWSNHGCPDRRYGDDGEMQCHSCGIDFKREEFEKLWKSVAELRLIAACTEKVSDQGGNNGA